MTRAGQQAPRLDELIGTADAARRLDVMPWIITGARRRGELRAYKLPGNRAAFHIDELDAWATARTTTPSGAT